MDEGFDSSQSAADVLDRGAGHVTHHRLLEDGRPVSRIPAIKRRDRSWDRPLLRNCSPGVALPERPGRVGAEGPRVVPGCRLVEPLDSNRPDRPIWAGRSARSHGSDGRFVSTDRDIPGVDSPIDSCGWFRISIRHVGRSGDRPTCPKSPSLGGTDPIPRNRVSHRRDREDGEKSLTMVR